MRAMILAAGEGRRMRPLTYLMPKPMIPVDGVPMIERQILALRSAGITEIVVNAAYGGKVLRGLLGNGARLGVSIEYSVEGEGAASALETLGGIAKALPMLGSGDESFLVVAGDIVTDFDYSRLVRCGQALSAGGLDAHLVLVDNPSYHASGDMSLDAGGFVRREPRTHTFSSLGVYRAGLFEGVPAERASLFPWLWDACAAGRVTGEIYNGLWLNVGDPFELQRAESVFREKKSAFAAEHRGVAR